MLVEQCKGHRINGFVVSFTSKQLIVCVKEGNPLTLENFYSSIESQFLTIKVDYCKQEILDQLLPGRKCKSKLEIEEMIPKTVVCSNHVNSYFDQKQFSENPIKKAMYFDETYLVKGTALKKILKIQMSEILLSDSWLDFAPSKTKNAYEV